MRRPKLDLFAVVLIAAGLGAGHGVGHLSGSTVSAAERQPLYYQDPTGKPDYSPTLKKDSQGRNYVPVYEEPGEPAAKPQAQPAATPDTAKSVSAVMPKRNQC